MRIVSVFLCFIFVFVSAPVMAQQLARLDGYQPPPMFETTGYDDASIRESAGYDDGIEREVILDDVLSSVIEGSSSGFESEKPPLPPKRPVKVSLSREYAEQLRAEFENGQKQKVAPKRVSSNKSSDTLLENSLIEPSAEDLLNFIDPQN